VRVMGESQLLVTRQAVRLSTVSPNFEERHRKQQLEDVFAQIPLPGGGTE
jgi:hypothetical protein